MKLMELCTNLSTYENLPPVPTPDTEVLIAHMRMGHFLKASLNTVLLRYLNTFKDGEFTC